MTLLAEDGLSRLIAMGFLTGESGQTVVLHRLLASSTREMSGEEAIGNAEMAVAATMEQTVSAHRQRHGHLSTLPISVIHLRSVSDALLARKTPTAAILATLLGSHFENIGDVAEAERNSALKEAAQRLLGVFELLHVRQEATGLDRIAVSACELKSIC